MDASQRALVLAAVALLAAALLAGQGLTASPEGSQLPDGGEGPYPGHTLVAVQAKGWFDQDNGEVRLVDRSGDRVWTYDPPNAWVFDAELLRNGNVLVSMGESALAPGVDCPDEYDGNPDSQGKHDCIRNRVVEVTMDDEPEVVWEHSWYDAYPTHHEVHDADRLPNGETLIADMGNHRVIRVNQQGTVTWEWRAQDHISEGTEFWEQHVPAGTEDEFRREGPESDWTHLNDVDRLSNGNYLLSIRNYDTVLEVDPSTKEIVNVTGGPGKHDVMEEQHNPNMLERHGTMLVADSEGDRVVEVDAATDEIVWRYDGTGSGKRLQWPRDADRLPNGNTLITDSRNFRVLELDENGTVVWRYGMPTQKGIIYEADRVFLDDNGTYVPEEPDDVPSGRNLETRTGGPLAGLLATVESWSGFFVPFWVGVPEMLLALVGIGAGVGAVVEYRRART